MREVIKEFSKIIFQEVIIAFSIFNSGIAFHRETHSFFKIKAEGKESNLCISQMTVIGRLRA